MARGLSKTEVEKEWQALPKNWYAIYQWKRTSRAGYLEWIAEWTVASFPQIQLIIDGLRDRSFKAENHRGQIDLQTEIEQLTEKRLVRAMFNSTHLPPLGTVVDYEVPLKDTKKAKHGNIDLLSELPETALCVEAKEPNSQESILKAVLEAYVYTSLVSTKKQLFLKSFELNPNLQLTPAILTFANAQSGRQLKEINEYPHLLELIGMLNSNLAVAGIAPLRFFVIENPDDELKNRLTTTTESNGDVKVVFREKFDLSIVEQMLP